MSDMFQRGYTKAGSVEESNRQEQAHAKSKFPGLMGVVVSGKDYSMPGQPMQNNPGKFTNKSRTKKGPRNA